jgi:hypothetical protein
LHGRTKLDLAPTQIHPFPLAQAVTAVALDEQADLSIKVGPHNS